MTVLTMPLRHLAEVRVSNVDKKTVDGQRPVRLCNYTDVYYAEVIHDDREFMQATATPEQIERFRLRVGDTLITKDSETAEDIAVTAYVADEASDLVCGYHLAILRPRRSAIEPRFLAWATRSDFCREQFIVEATGVTRFGLKYEAVLGVDIPTPPLALQRQVADFLDDQVGRIDEIIRLREAQGSAARERFRSMIAERVDSPAGRLVPLRRVLVLMQTGSTPTIPEIDAAGQRAVPWYTPDSFGSLGTLGLARRWYPRGSARSSGLVRFPAGSVLFVGIGWASGRVAYLPEPGAGNQQLTAMLPNRLMRGRFLLWQMLHLGERLRRNAPFTVIPVLNNDYLRSSLVRLPDLADQDQAIEVLDSESHRVLTLENEMRDQVGLLQERKRSLITAAVMGEFDVSSASGRGVA